MDLYTKLSTNMKELAGTFETRMLNYERELKKMSSAEAVPTKSLEALTQEFTDFKSLIWKTLGTMKSQLELLVLGLDRQETVSRRKVLLFHGVPETDEDVGETVSQLLSDQLKLPNISSEVFSSCHRLGTYSSKPRPIMVRFANFKLRTQVWNAKTVFKGSPITISEFLTKSRHDVFTTARKHFGIKNCWTTEGRIVILLPGNKRRRIESMTELKPLLSEFPGIQLSQARSAPAASIEKGKTSSLASSKSNKVEPRSRRTAK